ncbi:MAG: translation initiation factor [Candidatus Marinimicrobia bacterium]|jgi:translation initiation factor 1|nr:translation initiation factor [Candidatus Neomarinimicrobiota bacterium]MBT3618326.1 translation initiation factor [Candidatus Neomarinimicrobiota bacterium]MBT3828271.1 translation initiation factor [Candidatus Neomarinimicrobiota bacterium]MBT3997188.1 translation initiation factor [Candidatus Neomarinimicrobiota bacterium]MBT4280654.1 translation initiation factor [Candidatus Neomarinimicrobiota bacterium]
MAINSQIVFSTDPDSAEEKPEQKTASKQDFRIMRRKLGGGKMVTIVSGFKGTESNLKSLGKELKISCGSGGSVKNGEILIQGDHRDKIVSILIKKGHIAKPSGG